MDEKKSLKFCLFIITSKNTRALQRKKKLSNMSSTPVRPNKKKLCESQRKRKKRSPYITSRIIWISESSIFTVNMAEASRGHPSHSLSTPSHEK
jgi:hypothetical protein